MSRRHSPKRSIACAQSQGTCSESPCWPALTKVPSGTHKREAQRLLAVISITCGCPSGPHYLITTPIWRNELGPISRRYQTFVRGLSRYAYRKAVSLAPAKQFGAVRTVAPTAAAAQAAPKDHPADGSVPPEFAQQLQQPPVVVPPPANPPSGKSPFGLDR